MKSATPSSLISLKMTLEIKIIINVDQSFENQDGCRLVSDHYGNETFSLHTI